MNNISFYNPLIVIDRDTVVCSGSDLYFFNQHITGSGFYEHHIPTKNLQCDSIHYTLNVKINSAPLIFDINIDLCYEESYIIDGYDISHLDRYTDQIKFKQLECDSLINHYNIQHISPNYISGSDTLFVRPNKSESIDYSIEGSYDSLSWHPKNFLSCNACTNPMVMTDQNILCELTVFNKGCITTRSINVIIKNDYNFYIPNIIYGHQGSSGNNEFYVQCNIEDELKYDLYIYDRFGNLIFKGADFTTNNNLESWTPSNLNPGVYVYMITFRDNINPRTLAGDITVIE